MIDFIVNNIFVLIPLAIFLALRILEARKKADEKSEAARRKGGENIFEPFLEEDNDEDEAPAAAPWVETFTPPQQPVKRLLSEKKTPPEAQLPEAVKEEKALKKNAGGTSNPKAGPSRPADAGKDFAAKLETLSPLQKAVVMAEILGPPKGI